MPRPVLTAGARALRRRQPELATALGIALSMDVSSFPDAQPLRDLGIEPRSTSAYIDATAQAAAGA